jgi:DNA-binding Lrp family transcriptional regulator
MRAYVLINTKPGTSEDVLKSLKKGHALKGIVSADSVFGRFDAILVIDAENLEDLGETVYRVIEKNPNIVRTETAVVLPLG